MVLSSRWVLPSLGEDVATGWPVPLELMTLPAPGPLLGSVRLVRTAALLVTGAGSALTTAVLDAARQAGRTVPMARATDRRELDLADPFGVRDVVRAWARVVRADGQHRAVVVSIDAWTDAAGAEATEDDAYAVNASGPAVLASVCAEVGAWLLHVSTAEVFGGPGPHPADEAPQPVSALGRTRLAGEQAVREIHPDGSWVVRAGWVYGPAPTDVVGAAAAGARTTGEVVAFPDQQGSPTWAADLGPVLVALALSDTEPGLLHAAPPTGASFFELAREVFTALGADPDRVRPGAAPGGGPPRPHDTVLVPDLVLPDWRVSLRRALSPRGTAEPDPGISGP